MRVLAATLAVLLLVAICSLAEADLRISSDAAQMQKTNKNTCCFAFASRRLPRSMIRSAYRTGNSCPKPAVVLVTRNGRKVCVDPKARWVQKHLKHLELPEH
ncbi:CCL3 protein, partial [Chaetorhynchus papuensis]|nr:CCL3 protein [Chaetorhynchus papuensis]